MSKWIDVPYLTALANEDMAKFRRVRMTAGGSSTSPPTVGYARAGETGIGITRAAVPASSTAPNTSSTVGVILLTKDGTLPMIADGAVTAMALVYPAGNGKATATVTGQPLGRALQAASADGDYIEVLPILFDMFPSDVAGKFTLKDDFFDLLLTGAEALWKGTQTDTGTFTILDTAGGILQLEASDGSIADNDESYAGTQNKPFLFAANKPLFFEAKVALKAADTDNANVIVGLCSAGSAANDLLDDGGGPPASYSGIVVYKIDSGAAWAAEASIAGTQIAIALTAPGAPGVTYQRVGIEFIPTSATVATVNIYIDGVLVGTTAAFTYTSAVAMSALVGVKNGGSTVNTTLYVDYVLCSQVR